MRALLKSLIVIALAGLACAQAPSANTVISDTVTSASGPNPSGTIEISWTRYENNATPRQVIYPGSIVLRVTAGVVNVSLFPNSVALPAGGCYVVNYALSGINQLRYWFVPVSPTPLLISQVESTLPCTPSTGITITPGQITDAGASAGQVLTFNGTYWAPANGGGSGGGTPGGTNGQIQYNNLGSFGGFNISGDCTLARPTLTCTSTNGKPFVTSAWVDTTNASNISSGILGQLVGGTGASLTFMQGSVIFAGSGGPFSQDNSNLFWDSVNHRLGIGTTTPTVPLTVTGTGSQQTLMALQSAPGNQTNFVINDGSGVNAWVFSATTSGQFAIFNTLGNSDPLTIDGGAPSALRLFSTGDFGIGNLPTDCGYRLCLEKSGASGTAFLSDLTLSTGTTLVTVQAGAGQGSNDIIQYRSNTGEINGGVDVDGESFVSNPTSGNKVTAMGTSGLFLAATNYLAFCSGASIDSCSPDVFLDRASAGVAEIDNGTPGAYRDLIVRNLTISGGVCMGCPGGGTVTNTAGPLTLNSVMIGNGGADSKVLGSLGTSGYVLTSNGASLPPTWQPSTGGGSTTPYTICPSGCTTATFPGGTPILASTHGQGINATAFALDFAGHEIYPQALGLVNDGSGNLTFNYSATPSKIIIFQPGASGGGGGPGLVSWSASGSSVGTSAAANFTVGSGLLLAGSFPGSVATFQFSPDTTVLQTRANLQSGTAPNVIVSSSASSTTYTATAGSTLGAYASNQSFRWTVDVSNTCTSGCSLNISGLGAKTVSDAYGNALVAGELGGGSTYTVTYNGTKFLCSECRNLFTSAFQGLVPLSGGGTSNFLRADGTWAVPPSSGGGITQLTGNVTAGPGSGSVVATIPSNTVTLAMMANLTANSFIGNNTGSSVTPIAMSQAQATALLNQFSSSLQGLVPGSGGGASNFLRADGTWAAPAGTGTVTVASGTASLSTSSIGSGTCVTTTITASGVASTDSIIWNPNASIKAVTGYTPSTGGGLSIAAYPTSGNVLFDVCNWTGSSITPGSVVLNWRITR